MANCLRMGAEAAGDKIIMIKYTKFYSLPHTSHPQKERMPYYFSIWIGSKLWVAVKRSSSLTLFSNRNPHFCKCSIQWYNNARILLHYIIWLGYAGWVVVKEGTHQKKEEEKCVALCQQQSNKTSDNNNDNIMYCRVFHVIKTHQNLYNTNI